MVVCLRKPGQRSDIMATLCGRKIETPTPELSVVAAHTQIKMAWYQPTFHSA